MDTSEKKPIVDFIEILNGIIDHYQESTGTIVPGEIKSLMLYYGKRTALIIFCRFMGYLAANENIKNGQFIPLFFDLMKDIAVPFKECIESAK